MQTLKRIITSFQNQSQINACSECLAEQPEQGPKSLVASHFYILDIFPASLSTTTVLYKTNVYDRNLNSEKPEGEVLSWHPSCQLVKVLPPTRVGTSPKWPILCGVTRHKIGHFGDVPKPISVLGMTEINLTKAHIHQSKEMYNNKINTKSKARLSRLPRHTAWKQRESILVSALRKFITYLLKAKFHYAIQLTKQLVRWSATC